MNDLTPEKANDGKMDTRWSGISGHNEGVWYQLEWKEPVEVGEVVIHQFDTFAMEWNVQVRDAKTAEWRTVQHFGKPGVKLPLVVACRFTPVQGDGRANRRHHQRPELQRGGSLQPALRPRFGH